MVVLFGVANVILGNFGFPATKGGRNSCGRFGSVALGPIESEIPVGGSVLLRLGRFGPKFNM